MARIPTISDVRSMSHVQRRALYENACRIGSAEAVALANHMIEEGLYTTPRGGLPRNHPIISRIEDIARSPEGRAAAKFATDQDLPAMAGVDPLLAEELGADYGTYDTTGWAGTFVAEEMEIMGYKQTRKKPMPKGCVAKTAAFFKKR